MSNSGSLLGGWSDFNFTLTTEAKDVFDQALKGLVGVKYTPLAFATQVVSGLNYSFLCKGEVVVPGMPQFAALIHIYKPLEGPPHVTGITRIQPGA